MAVCREKLLWLSVILRAQMDARGEALYINSEPSLTPKFVMYLGRKWLTHRTRSLDAVCEMAGMCEGQVERLLREERGRYGN